MNLKQIIVDWPHTGFCSIMFVLVGDCISLCLKHHHTHCKSQSKTKQDKLDVVNMLDLPGTSQSMKERNLDGPHTRLLGFLLLLLSHMHFMHVHAKTLATRLHTQCH